MELPVSINLTQDMRFETDDLESFKAMLSATVRAVFRHARPVSDTQTLYLERKEPSFWPDGKSYADEWRSQPPFLNDGGECRVLRPDATYGGATQMAFASPPVSADEAAKLCCAEREESKPTRRWVTTLRDSAYNESDRKDKLRCRGPEDAVAKILVLLRQDDDVSLDGIRNVYAGGDGGYGRAYRMQCGHGTRPEIYISATWAYYSK